MAPMARSIKNCLVALALLAVAVLPAEAATFSMKRGLNLDSWATWPPEDRWGDPEAILPFPEWRKSLDADGLAGSRPPASIFCGCRSIRRRCCPISPLAFATN